MGIGKMYLNLIRSRLLKSKSLADRTMDQLSNEEISWSLNRTSNSIHIIVQHISGNMISRWSHLLTTDGEKPSRNRDKEFIDTAISKDTLLKKWEKGWHIFLHTLDELTEEDLSKEIYIRGEKHLVMEAIERQIAHYNYHIGQIVYIGKQIKGSEWESLSIPIGTSNLYTKQMHEKHDSDL